MVLNNSLNDSIIRIKNGQKSRKKIISLLKSNIVIEILTILQREGYIKGFKVNDKNINVYLKYFQDRPAVKDIIIYPQLSVKSTISFKQLKNFCRTNNNGLSLTILSTPHGLLSEYNCLRNCSGGNLLLTII